MDKGWVKLHRQMFSNELWLSEAFTKAQAWIDLFANANHEDGSFWVRGNEIKIKRGEIGWSELTMCKRWRWSRQKVRGFLAQLEHKAQIRQQKLYKITTIIAIINYDRFQSETTDRTTERQQKDNRPYTNKNDKNVENDKKDTIPAEPSSAKPSKFNPLGTEIIKAFENVDPKNKTYYANTTQRSACDFLLKEHSLEDILKRIRVLPKTNKVPFFPKINSPNDLKEKWVKLQDAVDSKKAELSEVKNKPNYIL